MHPELVSAENILIFLGIVLINSIRLTFNIFGKKNCTVSAVLKMNISKYYLNFAQYGV